MEKSRPVFEFGQAIRNTGIPPKTKCCICKRVKQINQYSTKQLDELRLRVRRYGQANAVPKEGLIRCRDCSGSQNREMKCTMCLKVKPLEGFSLAQRSKKDDAICLQCHEDLDATHPDDRKLATAHDNTLAYNKEMDDIDDASSTASSEVADIWLWDRETGDYATKGDSSSRSNGGVPLPRSSQSIVTDISQMDIRPWTRARRASIPSSQPAGTALTRKNLAKLTVSDKASSGQGAPDDDDSSGSDSSSSSSDDDTSTAAGVPLGSHAGNSAHASTKPGSSAAVSNDGSRSGPVFRAYDPSGAIHMQRRRPSTVNSAVAAAAATVGVGAGVGAGGWRGHKYVSTRDPNEDDDDDDRHRAFARVRPLNPRTRRYVDDDIPAPALLSHVTPSRTGINTGIMEDVDSDDD